MTAEKNSSTWSAGPFVSFDVSDVHYDTLDLSGYNSKNEERLFMPVHRNSQGNYVPEYTSFSYGNTIGQDVWLSHYILDSTVSNRLTFSHIDLTNKVASGSFDLTFKKTNGDSSYPATVHFARGSFKSQIIISDYKKGPFVY